MHVLRSWCFFQPFGPRAWEGVCESAKPVQNSPEGSALPSPVHHRIDPTAKKRTTLILFRSTETPSSYPFQEKKRALSRGSVYRRKLRTCKWMSKVKGVIKDIDRARKMKIDAANLLYKGTSNYGTTFVDTTIDTNLKKTRSSEDVETTGNKSAQSRKISSPSSHTPLESDDLVENSCDVEGFYIGINTNTSGSNNSLSSGGDSACASSPESTRKDSRMKLRFFDAASIQWFENNILIAPNGKLILSFIIWYTTYWIMGALGGAVAYMHFPRTDANQTEPLPDYGYDLIPYWCPAIPLLPHGNIQSVVLACLGAMIVSGVVVRWVERKGACGRTILGTGDGRLILQRLFHLSSLIFITRSSTVGVTGLPQPNPTCVSVQGFSVTYHEAFQYVLDKGFPYHSCGDLIYSGHVGCIMTCMTVLHKHNFLKNRMVAMFVWSVALLGTYSTISCRTHYTVDVVLALYFSYFLGEWYFIRVTGQTHGKIGRAIQWLEGWAGWEVSEDG